MSDDEADGCFWLVVMVGVIAFVISLAWDYNHQTPERLIQRQQVEQRAAEDKDLAEWIRAKQLREMRADKANAEDAK